ncbi:MULTISPECIES: hypothetical protein [unclassified Thermosynechococcus]|uniref:hypothetical protein n=1 Tax=unclassified Thermosynechococcus TaxID=2622553 RepID=UPI0025ED5EE4|nr:MULTISPECIES: hypothetical protein [unclassified Thermosynechococcus]
MNSELLQWVKDSPCHIRQNAIFEAWLAFKASPNARFRSIRDKTHTLQFNQGNYRSGTGYPRLTKGLSFVASEPVPRECNYGTEFVRIKDRWYATFPEPVVVEITPATGVIALDSGVRTFLTGGDAFVEIGKGDFGRTARLYLDSWVSRMTKVNAKRRPRMRMARVRERIQNLIDECHKQVAHGLTTNYRLLFLPTWWPRRVGNSVMPPQDAT